jgi:VWFA-related protein
VTAALLAAGVLLLAATPAAAGDKGAQPSAADLPENWRLWLEEEIYPLITKEQRQAFLALETDAQRRAFAERLWILWGRQTGYGSSFQGMYRDRLQFCRLEFGNTKEDRARALLIHGPPAVRFKSRCSEFFVPLEIWVWPYLEGLGEDVTVLFYQNWGSGPWRMWYAMQGRRQLTNLMPGAESRGLAGQSGSRLDSPRYRCPDGDTLMNLMAAAEYWSRDPAVLRAMTRFGNAEEGGPESATSRFMEFSALLDKKAEPLEVSVGAESWGTRGGLVHVGFAIDVPAQELGSTTVGDVDVVQLDVIGEISHADQMVDRFRYIFSVPSSDEDMSLLVERFVRPGDYELRLKVEDVHSDHAGVVESPFEASIVPTGHPPVPVAEAAPEAGADVPTEVATTAAGTAEGEAPPLRLLGPEGEAISGVQRFEAVTTDAVARVSFLLDNQEVLTKNRPPFDVDLDLGPLPRLTTITAVGYDARGDEVARRRLSLNVGRERFYVKLAPLSSADTGADGRTRVAVNVNIPTESALRTLDLYFNEQLLASLRQPPFETRVKVEGGGQVGYLRAVATLEDGSVAEDIQYVNAPQFGSVVDVTTIELPVTVLDHAGHAVEDLAEADFEVLEDGVEQTITHFALHRDVAIHLGIVVDTSGSMEETLPAVQGVVMGFLRDLLRPRDRAFIETFSDRPDVLATFTADFKTLENALLSLFADRSTALHDAVIMGLFQFSGVRGRKAMVVLTDGEDNASSHDYDEVLAYAQRAGVTIYTIGIDLPLTKISSRWQLSRVADHTGGKAFFVGRDASLDRIYDEIDRELRTQYLLAYTSTSDKPPSELRKVEVRVDRPKVKIRTLSGYYPGGV